MTRTPRRPPPPRDRPYAPRQPSRLRERPAQQELDLRVGAAQFLPGPPGQRLVHQRIEAQQHLLARLPPPGGTGAGARGLLGLPGAVRTAGRAVLPAAARASVTHWYSVPVFSTGCAARSPHSITIRFETI